MSTTIIIKNSATSGSVPPSLAQGEFAVNVTDGKLFYGSGSGNVVKEFTVGSTITTGSFATTGSNTFLGNQTITGSLTTTGSTLFISFNTNIVSSTAYTSSDFFLVRNATTTLKVNTGVEITSSASNPLHVFNSNNNNLLQVSQSGVVILSTSSVAPTGTAPNGSILFTATDIYIGTD